MQQTRVIAPMGKAFVAIATIEAFTWAGLLIGMYLKYGSGTTDAGVWLFGRLHGLAFITYIVIAVMAGHRLRWSLWAMLAAIMDAGQMAFALASPTQRFEDDPQLDLYLDLGNGPLGRGASS